MQAQLIKVLGALVVVGLSSCSADDDPVPSQYPGSGGAGGTTAGAGGSGNEAGAGGSSGGSAGVGGNGGNGGNGGDGASSGSGGAAVGGSSGAGAMAGVGGLGSGGDSGSSGSSGSAGAPPACTTDMSLKEAGSCTDRLIGTALAVSHLQEAEYVENAREFNYVTPENEMKWDQTEPTRDQFTFAQGDQIVDFAMDNGMAVKGHALVWYNQLPSWVSAISDADDLRSAMVNHIQQVMEHYRGQVIAWDVVNEAWSDEDPTMLRDSVFSRVLGRSYIEEAFTAAREADPDAKLFYNDYATDGLSEKSNSVYEMVRDLKERDIPIDGVGLQMHWRSVGSTLTAAQVIENIQRLAALGVEVVISEMDVQLCRGGTLEDQQVRYHDIVAACVSQPACTAVTFWGITDKYSWLNDLDLGCTDTERPRPLLWDDDYQKKLAYTGVLDALLGR